MMKRIGPIRGLAFAGATPQRLVAAGWGSFSTGARYSWLSCLLWLLQTLRRHALRCDACTVSKHRRRFDDDTSQPVSFSVLSFFLFFLLLQYIPSIDERFPTVLTRSSLPPIIILSCILRLVFLLCLTVLANKLSDPPANCDPDSPNRPNLLLFMISTTTRPIR